MNGLESGKNLKIIFNRMLLLRCDYICGKGFESSYHTRISLIGNMHVGLIIIKDGENIREVINRRTARRKLKKIEE